MKNQPRSPIMNSNWKRKTWEDVYTRLDDYLENWEEGASIPLNAPGGEIAIETLEILNSEGEVLY